jgi:hypothetical protein
MLWLIHDGRSGQCNPACATIAEKAGCAPSTVGEAIKALGILSWVNRIHRVASSPGRAWQRRRTKLTSAERMALIARLDTKPTKADWLAYDRERFCRRVPTGLHRIGVARAGFVDGGCGRARSTRGMGIRRVRAAEKRSEMLHISARGKVTTEAVIGFELEERFVEVIIYTTRDLPNQSRCRRPRC